ncbi:hypothetical protein EGW08_021181 [Elysia chlorotica]|uniref:Uncharacterized protein n=1 Tax=Elysia chlorotica TaxID=188477 RepID=A0A3S0Z7D6_ELYCH|nr:hypothetical protein EGW08_021181 [Elysia chlorotica]
MTRLSQWSVPRPPVVEPPHGAAPARAAMATARRPDELFTCVMRRSVQLEPGGPTLGHRGLIICLRKKKQLVQLSRTDTSLVGWVLNVPIQQLAYLVAGAKSSVWQSQVLPRKESARMPGRVPWLFLRLLTKNGRNLQRGLGRDREKRGEAPPGLCQSKGFMGVHPPRATTLTSLCLRIQPTPAWYTVQVAVSGFWDLVPTRLTLTEHPSRKQAVSEAGAIRRDTQAAIVSHGISQKPVRQARYAAIHRPR